MLEYPARLRTALLCLHSSPLAELGKADAGGMNLYVRRLADELPRLGIATDVFTRRTDPKTSEILELPSGGRIIQVTAGPTRWLPKSSLPFHVPAMAGSIRTFIQAHDLHYDVIHSHYWISGLVASRLRAGQMDPPPLIHMFHTLSKLKELHTRTRDRDDSDQRSEGERCLIGRCDVIVGATEAERHEMETLYARRAHDYRVIPPGVDMDLFRPRGKAQSRRRLNIGSERVLLFVGRLDSLKGLDRLLGAIGLWPSDARANLRLLVVGGFERSESRRRYEQLVARHGLESIVDFRGKVRQEELPHYYSAAELCAMPSSYESFGIVALESMACETPVVAYRVGGLATTIQDERTGFLVRPGDHRGYSQALQSALFNADVKRMGRNARASIERYTWESCAEQTLELYEAVLEQRKYQPALAVAGQ